MLLLQHGAAETEDEMPSYEQTDVGGHSADELTGLEEHLRDTLFEGDARRCPRHPGVKTSSDDGMFDGVCGACESENEDAAHAWSVDPTNTTRTLCAAEAGIFWSRRSLISCLDTPEDAICF
jgi:hypothetical protein